VVTLRQPVENATLESSKMYPALKRATIAQLVIIRATMAYRIAWGVFPGSTKMKKANNNAKNALRVNIA
jgi:hypothetical protein